MRLVAWNIENVVRRLGELPSVLPALGDPDVLCLQELRIRAQDAADVTALENALPGYRCHYSLPRDPHNVTYRGGRAYGVATFVRIGSGPIARPLVPDWDREGRVVITRRPRLSIVNLYAVNGTSKPYLDEAGQPSGDRHAFKRAFQARLLVLAMQLRERGGVILAGDWNVSRTALDTYPRLRTEAPHARARAALNAGLERANLVDIWRLRHPGDRGYTWYAPWAKTRLDAARVDYIVVSTDLVSRVQDTSILPRHPWSDHAPIALDLD
jgi:exodeoxyribonuclease-3